MTTDALGMLLGTLAIIMTIALFITRQMMLGFPCAIFWGILGGFSYNQSTVTWDIHYFLFFGSMGMLIFSLFAMYGLRERPDTIADEEMEKGEGKWIDEEKQEKREKREKTWYEDDGISDKVAPSRRARRSRAKRKGEFDF